MGLEAASFINDLNTANPAGGDGKSQGDDHLRLVKTVLKASLPGMTAARTMEDTTAGAGTVNFWKWYRKIVGVNGNLLGQVDIDGQDAAGNQTTFLRMLARIDDATNGSEDSSFLFQLQLAGALTTLLTLPLLHDQPIFIPVPVNSSYRIIQKATFPFSIQETTSICSSGTCTATFTKNAVAIAGTANAVSSAEQSQAHTDTFAVGDDLGVTVSANSACLNMALNVKIRREG